MIDTHCHLTFEPLARDLDGVLTRAHQAGVDRMICVGTTPADAQRAAELTRDRPGVFTTVGLHPHYVRECPDLDATLDRIEQLSVARNVVALGEMGLDRHYPEPAIDEQRRAFERQLAFATQTNLPIIIHDREATDDVLAMIRDSGIPGERFVFHCFTGGEREHELILQLGALVSFTGIVTFKNAGSIAHCAQRTPLARLMIETDAPFLTPEPHRKVRPNEPRFVANVAQFLAAQRGLPLDEFIRAVDANAVRFFRLSG